MAYSWQLNFSGTFWCSFRLKNYLALAGGWGWSQLNRRIISISKGGNFWWRKTYLMVHDAWPCVHNMTFAAQYHFSCKVPDESSRVVSNSSWLFFRYVPIEMNLLQLKRNSKYAKIKLESKDNEHVALSSDAGNRLALEHTILVIQPWVALCCALRNSYASLVLLKIPTGTHNSC